MKLGYHIGDVAAYNSRLALNFPVTDCYQIEVTPMSDLHLLSPDFVAPHGSIVLHGPFVNGFLTNSSWWDISFRYLAKVTEYSIRNKIRYMVFHPGGLADSQNVEEGKNRLTLLIERWGALFNSSDIIFCLENKAGGKKDICTCSILVEVLGRVPDCLNVALCLDTQHAWAAGELKEVVANWSLYRELTRVVHLNSVPPGNLYGGRKDNHSSTRLRDTDQDAKSCIDFFLRGGILDARTPVILERQLSLVPDDVLYVAAHENRVGQAN